MTPNEAVKLAKKYAPIFAQKITNEWTLADQIAPVDYPIPDAQGRLLDPATHKIINPGKIEDVVKNPERIYKTADNAIIPPKVYFSVCETSTHYFIIYAVYHVLDWWKRYVPEDLYNYIRDMLDEHMHDMEGALFIVTREPSSLIDGVVTIAHNHFYLYTQPLVISAGNADPKPRKDQLRVAKFNETIDGNIRLDKDTLRVKLYIESHGHGMKGDYKGWGSSDEIWYYSPEGSSLTKPDLSYTLEDIFKPGGLWHFRFDKKVFMQNKEGKWAFSYKKKDGQLGAGSANPPWSWNDVNDTSPLGEIATDPAHFIIRYAQGWGPVSTQYVYNPYTGVGV